PPTMRRVVVGPDSFEVTTVAVPEPRPGEVLVQSVLSGVCGSDTHAAHGRHPFVALPYRPGHEVVGVVRGHGADVTGLRAGQRVTVEPTLPCWHCKMCTSDRSNLCENLRFFGCGYDQGGMADYFTLPADRLHRIPDGIDDLNAALIEPLSTPVHAARLAGDLRGRAVVILGCGTIGLLTLAAVRHFGAGTVVMTDVRADKRELALRLGADHVVDASAPDAAVQARTALGESADVVFDCVANRVTVAQAVAMALKAGTVMVVGVPAGDISVPMALIQDQQVRIQGSATYLPVDFETAIAMVGAGEVRAGDLVTAQYPLEQVADAFAASASGEHVKVVLSLGPTA
ncbi:MAG: alcohol dehydrogenase GroES protein, partial [Friedmanniella sp.]|nr:alcohol dehydrogenase GroES protein [Friedmanniella sp.]